MENGKRAAAAMDEEPSLESEEHRETKRRATLATVSFLSANEREFLGRLVKGTDISVGDARTLRNLVKGPRGRWVLDIFMTPHENIQESSSLGPANPFNLRRLEQAFVDLGHPLYKAVYYGKKEAVQILLQAGFPVEGYHDERANCDADDLLILPTPLYVAVCMQYTEILTLLLIHGANPNFRMGNNGKTPLYVAARNGNLAYLAALAMYGADPDTVTIRGKSPLYTAAEHGKTAACKYLVSKMHVYVDKGMERQFSCGGTPLAIAAHNGHESTVLALLELGANVDDANALCIGIRQATRTNNLKIMNLLLAAPIRPHFIGVFGNKASRVLQQEDRWPMPARLRGPEFLQALQQTRKWVELWRNTSWCEPEGRAKLPKLSHEAIVFVRVNMSELGHREPQQFPYPSLAITTEKNGSAKVLEALLSYHANPSVPIDMLAGHTLFLAAASHFNHRLLRVLLFWLEPKHILTTNAHGWNALHLAAHSGCAKSVHLLLRSSLAMAPATPVGRRITRALRKRIIEERERALATATSLFDVDIKTSSGRTPSRSPLFLAASRGRLEIVKCLVDEFNADVDDQAEGSPLFIACAHGHVKVARFLLTRGMSPLMASADRPWASVPGPESPEFQVLLQRHNDPLHAAVVHRQVAVARMLIEEAKVCPLTHVNPLGWAAVHTAAGSGAVELLDLFVDLKGGLAVRTCRSRPPDADGFYLPLHVAVGNRQMKCMRYLLLPHVGADIDTPSGSGLSSIDVAEMSNFPDIAAWLSRAREWGTLHHAIEQRHATYIYELLRTNNACSREQLLRVTKAGDSTLSLAMPGANQLMIPSHEEQVPDYIMQKCNKGVVTPSAQAVILYRTGNGIRAALEEQALGQTLIKRFQETKADTVALGRILAPSRAPGARIDLATDTEHLASTLRPNVFCRATFTLVALAMMPWCPENHFLFPGQARQELKTFMMVNQRKKLLCKELAYHILSYVSR